jgi:hypothetical protein
MFNAQPFAAGIGSSFNADSPALSSDRTSRDTVRVLNEVKSPLIQMSEFFAGIDAGIIKLVNFAKESLGLDKKSLQLESRIADIMASDLKLEQKENLVNQLKGRDSNIAGEDTDKKSDEKQPEQLNFVDSLKKAFDDLTSNQTASELLKIFALAIGAMALAKFALKFKDQLSDVLEFIKKTLIPEFKDLNDDIDSYQGLGGLSKLKLFAKVGTAFAAIPLAISKFIIDPFGKIAKKIKGARVGAMLQLELFKQGGFFKAFSGFFKGVLPTIKKLTTSFTNGLKAFSKLSGISSLLKIGGLFLRFIAWPLQLVIGLFGGLTAGLKKFKEGGGMFEILGAFMVGVYDAIIGSTLNLIADIAGWVTKKLGFEDLGKKIQDLDFSFDSIITGIRNTFTEVLNFFKRQINKFRDDDNQIPMGKIVKSKAQIEKEEKQIKEFKAKIGLGETTSGEELTESKKQEIEKVMEKRLIEKVVVTDTNLLGDVSIKKFDSLDNDLVLDTKTTNMIAKNKELIAESKRLDAEIEKPAKSNNVYMDNKQVTGGTTVNNSKTFASNQRVESTDRSTKELNNVYGYALA